LKLTTEEINNKSTLNVAPLRVPIGIKYPLDVV
jgi:hypothetical protein